MSNKLYVGNISYGVQEANLEEAFGAHGTVKSVKIIKDMESGRSKGFGFVEMETADEAQACIESLHGKELDGRALTVNVARDKNEGGGGGRGPRTGGGGGGGFRGGRDGGGGGGGRDGGNRGGGKRW
jgi:RNA recognition motif-containing protein